MASKTLKKHILIYDGDCMLCSRLIAFVNRNNQKGQVRLITKYVRDYDAIYERYLKDVDLTIDQTLFFIENEKVFTQSEALMRLTKYLSWQTKFIQIGWVIPAWIRNKIYRYIAKNRLSIFGQPASCEIK